MATNSIKLLTGNSHPQLAKQVAGRFVLALIFVLYAERKGRGRERKERGCGLIFGLQIGH